MGYHRPDSETPFKWWWLNIKCWHDSFVIFQGIGTSSAKKPCFLFSGGGGGPIPSFLPLDPLMSIIIVSTIVRPIPYKNGFIATSFESMVYWYWDVECANFLGQKWKFRVQFSGPDWYTYGPPREKTCFGRLRTTKAQTSLCIRAGWSAPLLFAF